MKLSIYEVYVNIEDQPQADIMKQICIDYGLPYWDDEIGFELSYNKDWFEYDEENEQFYISNNNIIGLTEFGKTQVTESEFLELVKNI